MRPPLTSVAARHHSDRAGATRVSVLGVAAFFVAYLGFTQDTTSWLVLLPWFRLAGVGIWCAETADHAAVAFGNLAASLLARVLWTAYGPQWAFASLAAMMLASLSSFAVVRQNDTAAPGGAEPAGALSA